MKYEIVEVTLDDKDKLYKLLQFALYDGSQYIDNDMIQYLNIIGLIITLPIVIEVLTLLNLVINIQVWLWSMKTLNLMKQEKLQQSF